LSFSIDYSYMGDFFVDPGNTPNLLVASHGVFGGSVGLSSDKFDVILWGENLANKDYLIGRQTGPRGIWSLPRSYGVRMNYKF
jgi:outer membrane receptor protein involved in Fe transport